MPKRVEEQSAYRHDSLAPCTSDYIGPLVLRICKGTGAKRVLDIGCGNGDLCRKLVDAGIEAVGIEPSESGIGCARKRVPDGVFYHKGVYDDPDDISENDFDVVVSTEVIEHLYLPAALPVFAFSKLREYGLLVISTPYHGYLKNVALALANHWDAHHTPNWDGGHIKFWSRRSLTSLLEQNGFEVIGFHGVGRFPLLWKSMILVARKAQEGYR